jgi:hypothetical protein
MVSHDLKASDSIPRSFFPLTSFLFSRLAGLHGGCYELFGTSRVHAIRDLQLKDPSGRYATRALHYTVAGA